MNVEKQRNRHVAIFVLFNLLDDVFLTAGNLFAALSGGCRSVSMTMRFVQYDRARKYEDLTGGDFGHVIGCPGHYQGQCAHQTPVAAEEEEDE